MGGRDEEVEGKKKRRKKRTGRRKRGNKGRRVETQ